MSTRSEQAQNSSRAVDTEHAKLVLQAKNIHTAIASWLGDSDGLIRAVDGKTPEQMKAIGAVYREQYGSDMVKDLREELFGNNRLGRPSNEAALAVGRALYGDQAAMLAAIMTGVHQLEGIDLSGQSRRSKEQVEFMATVLKTVLAHMFVHDRETHTACMHAFADFFGPQDMPTYQESVDNVRRILLPSKRR